MITRAELMSTSLGVNSLYSLTDQSDNKSLSNGQTRKTKYTNSIVKYEVLKSDNTYEECTQHVYDYINRTDNWFHIFEQYPLMELVTINLS